MFLDSRAQATATWGSICSWAPVAGMAMEKTVPDRPWPQWLRTRMVQPLRRMISLVTQSPRPVPVSPLVVTKGSKMVGRRPAGMPVPVSAMVRLDAGEAVVGSESGDADADAAATAHGINGVADDVSDDLAEFAGLERTGAGRAQVIGWTVIWRRHAGVVELEDGTEDSGDLGFDGLAGLAVEAQGLAGDFGDAGQFLIGFREVTSGSRLFSASA